MSAYVVRTEAVEVADRIGQLRLTEAALKEAVNQAHLQRVRLTSNHPRIFSGLEMWGWCVAALREQLRSLGWMRLESLNYELTVNDEVGIAIVVASGDVGTGNPYAQPCNRSRKGRNTVEAIEVNRQADLFSDLLPKTKEEASNYDTWILLHHTDGVKREIRIELSRPKEIGKDGIISAWFERIILGSIPFDDQVEVLPPSGPDFEVEIRRKSS